MRRNNWVVASNWQEEHGVVPLSIFLVERGRRNNSGWCSSSRGDLQPRVDSTFEEEEDWYRRRNSILTFSNTNEFWALALQAIPDRFIHWCNLSNYPVSLVFLLAVYTYYLVDLSSSYLLYKAVSYLNERHRYLFKPEAWAWELSGTDTNLGTQTWLSNCGLSTTGWLPVGIWNAF